MIREFWITSRVGPENSRSRPRSMVILATIETSTAGSTAMTENRLTICTCSRAAPPPGLHHLPDLADDDADQKQDGRRVDQQEDIDDLGGRLDRREAGHH